MSDPAEPRQWFRLEIGFTDGGYLRGELTADDALAASELTVQLIRAAAHPVSSVDMRVVSPPSPDYRPIR